MTSILNTQAWETLLADTLTRAYITDHSTSIDQIEKTFEKIDLSQHIPVTTDKIAEIEVATKEDETLHQLLQTIKTGWPDCKQQVPWNIRQYFYARDELVCQDGVIYKGSRLLLLTSMRAKIMSTIHSSPLGTHSCILRARECVYWPGITSQTKNYVSKCEICRTYGCSQQQETLQSHEVPNRPWAKVGTDLFHFRERDYKILQQITIVTFGKLMQ